MSDFRVNVYRAHTMEAQLANRTSAVIAAMARNAELIAARAREYAPKRTGAGAAAIKIEAVIVAGESARFRIGVFEPSITKYMAPQELGSGLRGPKRSKYPIVPIRGKWLTFVWKDPPWGYVHPSIRQRQEAGGARVWLKRVSHPGVKPQHYLERALDDYSIQLDRDIRAAVSGD